MARYTFITKGNPNDKRRFWENILSFTLNLSIILPIFYFVLLAFIIAKSKFFLLTQYTRLTSLIIFGLKAMSGILMWAIYTYYYTDTSTGDMHNYFADARLLYDTFKHSPSKFLLAVSGIDDMENQYGNVYLSMNFWYQQYNDSFFNETHLIIRINALLMLISGQNFHVHTIFMAFLSFTGLLLIYKSLQPLFRQKALYLMPCVFLTPSLVFWSSGMLKEPIVILGLGLLLYGTLAPEISWIRRLVFFIVGAFMMLFTKFYVLFCILPPLAAFLIPPKTGKPSAILTKHLTVALMALLFSFFAQYMSPSLNFPGMLVNKQAAFLNAAELWNAGSFTHVPRLTGTYADILQKAPVGFYNTLCKPLPIDVNNVLLLAAFLENFMVLMFIIFCLRKFNKHEAASRLNFILFSLLNILLLFSIIGLTTPVIGALVRYKIAGMPFLLLIFLAMVPAEKLPSFRLKYITNPPNHPSK